MLHSGKKKAHKQKLFGPVALGTTPGMSQRQSQVFSLFCTMEAQFVPGTIPETKGGRKSLCVQSLCAFFTRYAHFWALLNGGNKTGGMRHLVWQERACMRTTQMTHLPSLKPRSLLRNQDKRVLAKGVSAESRVTPKETKNARGIVPSSTFGTHSVTANRGAHFCENLLQKTPFSWLLIYAHYVIGESFACHREKRTPPFWVPPI